METKRLMIIAFLVVCLAFGAGLVWRWVQGTPHYALYQIGSGLKNREIHTLLVHVDPETVLDRQVSEMVSGLIADLTRSETQGKLSTPLGEIKVRLSPEGHKGLARLAVRELEKYLKNRNNPTIPSSFALLALADIQRKGEYALVTLKKDQEQLRMGMKKQEGVWQVVELNPEDTRKIIKTYLLSRGR
ncbi:MAG: hypothetical protein AB1585_20805 [Thermodesulfobacteriota bacterium]